MKFTHSSSLRRLRRSKWVIWIQLFCMLGWTLSPPSLNALYFQDVNAYGYSQTNPGTYSPTWDGSGVGDPEPPEGADLSDNDTDGLPAWYEDWYGASHGAMVNMRGNPDSDNDGATDGDELHVMGTDPLDPQSKYAGVLDGDWWALFNSDSDGDGLKDWDEHPTRGDLHYGTDPLIADTDGDGWLDGFEVTQGTTSATDADSDDDGLTDWLDDLITNHANEDTDGDGLSTSYELATVSAALEYKNASDPRYYSTNGGSTPDGQNNSYLFPSDQPQEPPALVFTGPGSLVPAAVGSAYTSEAFTAEYGSGSYSWSITAGNLPSEFTLIGPNLVGTGTVAGVYSFTVQVADGSSTASAEYTLVVATEVVPLSISSSASLPEVQVGSSPGWAFAAAGGDGGYSFSAPFGLPGNLSLDTNGALSGSISSTASYSFTVRVTDQSNNTADQLAYLNVVEAPPPALAITSSATMSDAHTGQYYSWTFEAQGGYGNRSWSMTGTLPYGMTFSSDSSTAVISGFGFSASALPFSFAIQVTDQNNNSAQQAASLMVLETPPPVIEFNPPAVIQASVWTPLEYDLDASGGAGTFSWTLSAPGNLPMGFSIDQASGLLTGSFADAEGTFTCSISVTDGYSTVTRGVTFNVTDRDAD